VDVEMVGLAGPVPTANPQLSDSDEDRDIFAAGPSAPYSVTRRGGNAGVPAARPAPAPAPAVAAAVTPGPMSGEEELDGGDRPLPAAIAPASSWAGFFAPRL